MCCSTVAIRADRLSFGIDPLVTLTSDRGYQILKERLAPNMSRGNVDLMDVRHRGAGIASASSSFHVYAKVKAFVDSP